MDAASIILLCLIILLSIRLFLIPLLKNRSESFRRFNKKRKAFVEACELKGNHFEAAKEALRRLRGKKGAAPIESDEAAWICIEAISQAVQSGYTLRQIGTDKEEMMDFRTGKIPGFADPSDINSTQHL